MLGYTLDDIYKMQASISIARSHYVTVPQDKNITEIRDGLAMAFDFFDGLWAEGYFDNGTV